MTRKRLILYVLLPVALLAIAWDLFRPRPDAVFANSLQALARGDLEDVLQGIESLQGHAGYESHVHLLRGAYLLRRGDPAAALPSFKSVVPEGELRQPALRLTGECLFLLHQLPLAAAQFQELLKDNPTSANSHRWLGQIFYNLGAFDGAMTHLETLLEYEPDNYLAHALIGHMAFDFEDFKVSVEHYRKALAMDRPDSVPANIHQEVLRNLAQSLIGQNSYPEALKILDLADQDHALVLALKADCHRGLGHHDKAREFLDRSLAIDSDARKAVLLEVALANDRNDTEATIAPLQRLLARDPHDTACRYQLAQAWQRIGKPEEYKREIARHDESRQLKTQLTQLNLEANRDPQNAEVRDRLAAVCEKLGKRDLAIMWRQAAAACRQVPRPLPPSTPSLR